MSQTSYFLRRPDTPETGVVFSSPHSGAEYPADFLAMTRLDSLAIRSSEDAFVDRIFSAAPVCGAPLISARFPRAYVDLNRAPDELDPAVVRGVHVAGTNPRISAGLGVIPRVVAGHRAIRSGKISMHEAQRRLNLAYHPFHARLSALLDEQVARFGMAVLIDCHSMPGDALTHLGNTPGGIPDIVLGDRFGASCAPWIVESVAAIFEQEGFSVARNRPYAGGYITRKYGQPSRNIHAVQIEISRVLYMDERRLRPLPDFPAFCARLAKVTRLICDIGRNAREFAAE